jgi:hypothetical protein
MNESQVPKVQSVDKLTPGRVAQGLGGVFTVTGTPTCAPKPRGKSPGWQTGKKRHRKNRYPVVRKQDLDHLKNHQLLFNTQDYSLFHYVSD